ncbi:S-layer homology domain-containing protein [Cohnella sp. CFH 77786]|uniref:S-layer homology domain-containing protein n=1 Tax=Cohnella sp. CFH 77786 TaxID=2662265 RepID=UPI001C60A84E|nr:S-layer homology domain-containing protein [Cohnella sp. CFH 77786]
MKKGLLVVLTVLVLILAVPVYANGGVNGASSGAGFKDVKDSYWAKVQIDEAVKKGYVSGFPDGTFKPDQKVSRAEFFRMLADALKLPHGETGTLWYQPYVSSLIDAGIHRASDFDSKYDSDLSRLEMVRLAIRSTDYHYQQKDSVTNDKLMVFKATSKGILHGTGAGKLDLNGTTTRAQAIAIIERILSINSGKKIPVDKYAVGNAELAWHRTNIFTVMPQYYNASYNDGSTNVGINSWSLDKLVLQNGNKFRGELDELIAINLGDPKDPNRKLLPALDKMRYGRFQVPSDAYVLIAKYHIDYNNAPKTYSGVLDLQFRGFKQTELTSQGKLEVPMNLSSLDEKYDWINKRGVDDKGHGVATAVMPGSGYSFKSLFTYIDLYASAYPGSSLSDYLSSEIVSAQVSN